MLPAIPPIVYLLSLLGLGGFVAYKIGHTPAGHPAGTPSGAAPGTSAALPPTTPGGQRLVTLDANLPETLLQATINAVLYEKNPTALDALAASMNQGGFRCAGYELSYRAWELRGASGPPPVRPTTCGDSKQAPGVNIPGVTEEIAAEACRMIDPTMDGATCAGVLTALGTEADPANLETFAASLDQTHPRAAAALRQKAALLRGGYVQPTNATEDPSQPPAQQPIEDPGLQTNPVQQNPVQQFPGITVQPPQPIVHPLPLQVAPHLAQAATQAVHDAHLAHAGAVPSLVAEGAVPGAAPFTATEASYAPMEPAIAVAASLSPKLEGTTHHVEGSGNGLLAQEAVAQAAATAATAQGVPIVAQTARGARERPRGHWFLYIRAGDTPWPMTVAKLGALKKDPAALAELHTMNPHLWTAPGSGVIASFQPGDEVNIPGAWADALIKKGFKVKKD